MLNFYGSSRVKSRHKVATDSSIHKLRAIADVSELAGGEDDTSSSALDELRLDGDSFLSSVPRLSAFASLTCLTITRFHPHPQSWDACPLELLIDAIPAFPDIMSLTMIDFHSYPSYIRAV
ncbi:hypothetical protein HGRIS_001435 [Hohenbuehelia grisea]|uniref:Uncharacterized protein n=1 Tax=Hohenbuehelia grisea TaxID=104357 RepID=A0ABR3JPX1_9AGAR